MIGSVNFTVCLDSNLGTSLESNWLDAIRIAKFLNVDVKFTFNEQVYLANPESKFTDKPYLFSTRKSVF